MEKMKTVHKPRQRIASLPDALLRTSNSLGNLRHCPSSPKLPKDFLTTERKHTTYVSRTSSIEDITEERRPFDEANNKMKTNQVCFPALQGVQQATESPRATRKTKTRRLHSCGDEKNIKQAWSWVNSEGNHSTVFRPKSTFPEIERILQDNRRHSLPVSLTKNIAEGFSVSFLASESRTEDSSENVNSLPQVIHAKLKINQPDKHSCETSSEHQRKSSPKDMTGSHHCIAGVDQARAFTDDNVEYDQAGAMKTHVEKQAETGSSEMEIRAIRLFEWLKDQSDYEETR